jgi:hypothetical protein
MRKAIFVFMFIGLSVSAWAQSGGAVCTPNNITCIISPYGIYPQPSNQASPVPIVSVCPGETFDSRLTVVMPDSVTLSPGLSLNLNEMSITNIGVYNTFTQLIDPIPFGITYSCYSPQGTGLTDLNSSDCSFPERSCGCILLSGTIPNGAAPGDYDLTMLVRINGALQVSYGVEFPGSLYPVQGRYIIRVENCLGTETLYDGAVSIKQNAPNPFSTSTSIQIDATTSSTLQLEVSNLLGQVIEQREVSLMPGSNNVLLDGSTLGNGIYFYTFTDGVNRVSNKMLVQH